MAQSVSSGTIWLMGSELAFIISNYFIHIGLARHLGPETYGTFGVLMSLYLINRAFLNTGLPRAVSKFLSEFPEKAGAILRTSFRVQLLIAVWFGLLYILFAPTIAQGLNDERLTLYIVFIGLMVIPMALLSLYTNGYLNGLRLFREQAYVKTIYPLLRVIFTLILVWLGWALWGALVGYFLAIIMGLLWCVYLLRRIKKDSAAFPWKKIFSFAVPITIGSLAFALLRNVNVLFLKSILADNRLVGLYTAAFTLSTVTYMAFTGLPLTLTPSVSRATAAKDQEKVRTYIRQSVRYLLLVLFPLTALIAATSYNLLDLFYSSEYTSAAGVLSILVVASAFLALFSVFCSIVTGSGDPKMEMYWSLGLFVALAGLNLWLIPQQGMIGSAWASLITALGATIISGWYVYKKFNAVMELGSFLRIVTASVLLFLLASVWQYSGPGLLINYLALGLFYVLLMYLWGEIGEEEVTLIAKVLRKH